MKEIHAFKSALHQASHETTRLMSAQLRTEAKASGWPHHVVRNMGVTYGPNGFEAHVHDAHKAEAEDLEYGTPSQRPTAAVRRFANRTKEAEDFLVGRMSKMLGDL
jgi:hypothetical protein